MTRTPQTILDWIWTIDQSHFKRFERISGPLIKSDQNQSFSKDNIILLMSSQTHGTLLLVLIGVDVAEEHDMCHPNLI
jgi:hypothetical protein